MTTDLKLRFISAIPGRLQGSIPITVDRQLGVWTVGLSFSQLAPLPPGYNASTKQLLVFDQSTGTFVTTTISDAVVATSPRERLLNNRNYFVRVNLGTCSVSVASPGVVTKAGHGLQPNDPVVFSYPADPAAITVTIASPGVVTWTGHGFAVNQPVVFETTGALPTGITAGTTYFVIAAGLTANAFQFSATLGGAAVNTSGTQSGAHRGWKTGLLPTGLSPGTIYYVVGSGLTVNTFRVSATPGGVAINTTGSTTGIPIIATGNDANNGLAATRSGAYLTPQKAWDVVSQNLDLNAKQVLIKLADSTYTSAVVMSNGTVGVSSFAALIFEGNLTSPKNVSFNCATSTGCFEVGLGGVGFPIVATIRGLELKNSVNAGIQVWGTGTSIFLQNVEFGACAGAQASSQHQGQLGLMGTTYAVTGSATYGLAAISGGQIYTDGGTTVNYYNAPVYTFNFYSQGGGSNIYCGGMTFNGGATVTGIRYVSDENANIEPAIPWSNPAAATYIPGGGVDGIISRGGSYTGKPLPVVDGGTGSPAGYPAIIGGFASNVNLNSVADTQIPIICPTPNYRISTVLIFNKGSTASLTTAQYGMFSAAGGGGTTIIAGGTAMTAITSATINTPTNYLVAAALVAIWNFTSVFFRVTQAQGAAATADVYVLIQPLP